MNRIRLLACLHVPGLVRPPGRPRAQLLLTLGVTVSLLLVAGERAFASLADSAMPTGPLQIVVPAGVGPVSDGNLVLVEAAAADRGDNAVNRVEMAFDSDDQWTPAQQDPDDPTHWRVVWADPSPGSHRIRARAYGSHRQLMAEQSAVIEVRDTWTSSYIIDNPYAGAGNFRKGELHMHSTASFDGWNSLPPAQDALAYKAKGYQFVAISDHDVISYPQEVNDPTFIVIPSFESTADTGHITAPFATEAVSPDASPQERIDGILAAGGLPILAHPGWRIGWSGTDFSRLHGYAAIEIFNGATFDPAKGTSGNLKLWQGVLNEKGYRNRIWAVAVDDSHQPDAIDRGWVMVKTAELTPDAIKHAMANGAMYASNGPSFSMIGVMNGAIAAASPEAAVIRFFDQDGNVLLDAPSFLGVYRPSGRERWVRVEAIMADGRTAWSQPFWLLPNAPKVELSSGPLGTALVGQTLPGARVHIADHGQYLGNVVAGDDGTFAYRSSELEGGDHDFWVMASSPWPDQVEGPPTLMTTSGTTGGVPLETVSRWLDARVRSSFSTWTVAIAPPV